MRHPEDELQRSVASMLDWLGWWWWHTPNGGRRGRVEAARMKGLGVKPGVADVIVAERWERDRAGGPAVAIELKSPAGRLTQAQRAWLVEAEQRGWLVGVCRTMDEVMEVLQWVRPVNGRLLRP